MAAVLLEVGECDVCFKPGAFSSSSGILWIKLSRINNNNNNNTDDECSPWSEAFGGAQADDTDNEKNRVSRNLEREDRFDWDVARFGAELETLNDASVTSLLRTSAKIELWLAKGAEPSDANDIRLGAACLPLVGILRCSRTLSVASTLQLCEELDEELLAKAATIHLRLRADNALADFLLGGALLRVTTSQIRQAPKEWWAAPEDRVEPENSRLDFHVELAIARRKDAADDDGLLLPPGDSVGCICLSDGSYCNESVSWRANDATAFVFISARTLAALARCPCDWVLVASMKTSDTRMLFGAALDISALFEQEQRDGRLAADLAAPIGVTAHGHTASASLTHSGDGVDRERTLREALEAAGTVVHVTVAIESHAPVGREPVAGTWDGMIPHQKLLKGLTMADIVPARRKLRVKVPRDVVGELRTEIAEIVETLGKAYDTSSKAGEFDGMDSEQRQRWLRRRLSDEPTMHNFRINLTSRVHRVIRARYRAQPTTQDEELKLLGDCFTFLLDMTNDFLPKQHQEQWATTEKDDPAVAKIRAKQESLLTLALDAEANGNWSLAGREHKQRLSLIITQKEDVKQDAVLASIAATTWLDFAEFALRAFGDKAGRLAIGRCLELALQAIYEAFALEPEAGRVVERNTSVTTVPFTSDERRLCAAEAKKLHAAVLLEHGRIDDALSALSAVLYRQLPSDVAERLDGEDDLLARLRLEPSGIYLSEASPLTSAFYCVLFDARGEGKAAHAAIVSAATKFVSEAPVVQMYAALAVMLTITEYFLDYSLKSAATRALEIAKRAEDTARARCVLHSRPEAPPDLKSLNLRIHASLQLLAGDVNKATTLAAAACDEHESVRALTIYGDALHAQGRLADAAEPYAKAIALHADRAPLKLRVRHAQCLLQTGQNEDAKMACLQGAEEWQTSSLWLGAGIAQLRLGEHSAADKSLRLATIRSARAPLPHSYLALLHLVSEGAQQSEAYSSLVLDLAMRLGLEDASLLRELGNTYYQLERYAMAESLFRRAAANETGKSARAHARKRLADVLQAQNETEAAIAEYQQALDASTNAEERDEIAGSLKKLLVALGRSSAEI